MAKYLTEDELKRYMSAIDSRRKKVIFQTLLELGCRVGELCDLKLRWFDGVFVTVHDMKKSTGRKEVYRNCIISQKLADELEGWYFDEGRKVKRPGPAMFVYEHPRTLRRWSHDIADEVGIDLTQSSTHVFRGTYVRRAMSRGHNLKSICQQTGDTEETILKYYSKLSLDDRAKERRRKPLFDDIKERD